MLMQILLAGDIPTSFDFIRQADINNPKGYYEFERVKDLKKAKDKTWLTGLRGKVVKIISYLLTELPDNNYYKVAYFITTL